MRTSPIRLSVSSLAVSVALLAIALLTLASPAQGETPAASPELASVAATIASASAEAASTEAGPSDPASSAEPPSVPPVPRESRPAPAPATAESEEQRSSSGAPDPEAAIVPAVKKHVANVVKVANDAEATQQVKAVAEEASSAAAAPLKSVANAANVRPVVDEVVKSVSAVKRLPSELAPADPPVAAFASSRSPAASAGQAPADGQVPTSLPVPWFGDDTPSPAPPPELVITEPFETPPTEGAIAGKDLWGSAAGSKPLQLKVPAGILGLSIDPTPARAVAGSPTSPGGVSDHSPPPGPVPSPGSSANAAPGSGGGAFFVPIAALLALLALAAPAISRRWKEALAAPVPSRFVCALERPG